MSSQLHNVKLSRFNAKLRDNGMNNFIESLG